MSLRASRARLFVVVGRSSEFIVSIPSRVIGILKAVSRFRSCISSKHDLEIRLRMRCEATSHLRRQSGFHSAPPKGALQDSRAWCM